MKTDHVKKKRQEEKQLIETKPQVIQILKLPDANVG